MAKRIEGPYDFSDYNFATYSDGATWELAKGEDYMVSAKSLTANARRWAAEEGLEVKTKVIPETQKRPEIVALRFEKPSRLRAVGT